MEYREPKRNAIPNVTHTCVRGYVDRHGAPCDHHRIDIYGDEFKISLTVEDAIKLTEEIRDRIQRYFDGECGKVMQVKLPDQDAK
jgi:hypothetical protein